MESGLHLGKYLLDAKGHLSVPIGHTSDYKGSGRFRPVDTANGRLVTPSIEDLHERANRIILRNQD